jgi:hypothetical protein
MSAWGRAGVWERVGVGGSKFDYEIEDENEDDLGGRVRLRPNRGFPRRLTLQRQPLQVRAPIDSRGNRYRFICAIHLNRKKLFIREFLTHADYSKQGWKTRH